MCICSKIKVYTASFLIIVIYLYTLYESNVFVTTDIDECSPPNTNNCFAFENKECNNTQGGYECQCMTGYSEAGPDGLCYG